MSKTVKPNKPDPIAAPSARHNMVSTIVRFVVILVVVITILALAWSR